jgi:hypothetical protein
MLRRLPHPAGSIQRESPMMTQSYAARGASPRVGAAVCTILCIAVSSACSGVASSRGGSLGSAIAMGDDDANAPVDEAGGSEGGEDATGGPVYMGKPIVDQERDASASVASSDGYCPIPDMIASYGLMCPSCAQSHCASAIGECDPTMVNACAEYYCPTQCPLLDSGAGSVANPCLKVTQCCPTLIGTALGLTCITYSSNSAQSACQNLLSQAQAMGRCK